MREAALHRSERDGPHRRARLGHLAGDEPPPHQVVYLQVCAAQSRRRGLQRHVGRSYRLVRLLRRRFRLVEVRLLRVVAFAVVPHDQLLHRRARLLRDVHGVGSHVGDQAALVESLRHLHRAPGRHRKHAGRRLLQGRCGERRQGPPALGLSLQRFHLQPGSGQVEEHVVRRLLVADVRFLAVVAGELGDELVAFGRPLRRLHAHHEIRLGLESVDLALALHQQAQRDGLHAAGAERARIGAVDVRPQQRRHLVANQAVEYAAGLLRIHARHVYFAGMLHRLLHGALGDLVVGHPVERLFAGGGLQHLLEMPRDRLPFAVRIARQIDFVSSLGGCAKLGHHLVLARRNLVGRRESPLAVGDLLYGDRAAHPRQIAHMAHRTLDHEIPA